MSRPNSSVYLGDLAEGVSEQILYEVFSQAGTIQSVRLCRDSQTRRPLGYAYVNYATPADATRALETLNHTEICGRSVRLMPSQRDPSARRSGVGNVFAKNLNPDRVSNKILHETFEQFGRVLSAKVATDALGKSKGYGFVQYEDPESATRAIEELNLTDLCGQQLFVGPFIPAKDRAAEPGKFCNVYVRNIGSNVDEETLRTVFGEFGSITSTVVMRNSSGRSRGFGFVNFEVADHAAQAVTEMDGYRHRDGLKWKVNRAQKRDEHDAEAGHGQNRLVRSNLYLRNLDPTCSDDDLRELFEEFGLVETAKVLKDSAGKSKGVGFVQFSEPEDAEAAITGMNGKTMGDSPKPLFVTLAQRKQTAQTPRLDELPDGFPGLQSSGSMGLAPPLAGLMAPPPSMAFYPTSPQFYYGPMPVPPTPAMVNPYFLSMGSGPLPVNSSPLMDRGGSLVSIPSGPYGGMGSAPSAPVAGMGSMGSGIMSMNSGPLPVIPSESRASAPLPMYGANHGLLVDGHRRGRKTRSRGGAVYSPQVLPSASAMSHATQQPHPRHVLTSPFSAVQTPPTPFPAGAALVTHHPVNHKAPGLHPRTSSRSMSSASSMPAPTPPGPVPPPMSEEAAARRRSDQRRLLHERVLQRSSRYAEEVTQLLTDSLTQRETSQVLADDEALALKVDACVATLESAEVVTPAACAAEDQATEAESEMAAAQLITVPAT